MKRGNSTIPTTTMIYTCQTLSKLNRNNDEPESLGPKIYVFLRRAKSSKEYLIKSPRSREHRETMGEAEGIPKDTQILQCKVVENGGEGADN